MRLQKVMQEKDGQEDSPDAIDSEPAHCWSVEVVQHWFRRVIREQKLSCDETAVIAKVPTLPCFALPCPALPYLILSYPVLLCVAFSGIQEYLFRWISLHHVQIL